MPTDRLGTPEVSVLDRQKYMMFLDKCFPNDFLLDAVAVGQKIDGGADERVVLFVKLPPGQTLSDDFEQKIRVEIPDKESPRHVPARVSVWSYNNKRDLSHRSLITPLQVIQAPDIPYTLNSKRVEVLVKKVSFMSINLFLVGSYSLTQIINGAPLSSINPATLSNPECLTFYRDIGEILRQEISGE